ncbi:MAG: CIA30 family protein [Rhizobiales bacterium]|nr:CIA30 family protein [Hyphomicrobiales bacterium]
MLPAPAMIDDLSRQPPVATIGSTWELVTDAVMGGGSQGVMAREVVAGRPAIRMRGDVNLENNGGFVQAALDLSPTAPVVDASGWDGIAIDVFGNEEVYGVHLRTDYLARPWQSYRQNFTAYPDWRTVVLHFSAFAPYRTDIPLDTHRLRRIGFVAIGRAFRCDLAIGGLRYIRDDVHGCDHR